MKARLSFTSFSLALLFAFATGDRLYAQDDWDFGDAPDPTYPTLLANNGARHLAGQLRMGLNIDTEADGQPTAAANGDDINPSTADDEDGVTFNTALISGVPGSVTVQCNGLSGSEYLQAWIDFNVDGDWDDPGEQIITDYPPISGPNLVNFPVPAFAFPGGTATTYARFRLSSQPGLSYTNMASYGEVEDYMVTLYPLKWLQEPDLTETGVDVDTDVELADDFHCIQTGPITDIHIWGSYKGDTPTHSLDPAQLNNLTFVLKIWSDIPANPPGGVPYSHPGNLEWQGMFGPGQYQAGLVALIEEGEWWHSPQMDPPDDWIYPGDYHCYQYDFYIDPTNAFPQVESNVYWLGVQVLNNTGDYPFGWKSSTNHFNDDAVWWDNTQGQWRELLYGVGHPFATLPYPENSMDLSFSVSTEEEEEYDHKMHWPQLPDPNGWDVLACYHEEMGMQKVLADDFRCMRDGPISHITFWGSWSFDEFEEQDYYQGITNIHLSLHKDIPDPDGQGPLYSMPVVPAEWEWDINPTNLPPGWDLLVTPEIPSWQGWYDPNMDQYMENNHTNYFRYDVWIPADEAFVQTSNTIYWLDISVETIFGQWGWKTSRSEHFMDDAVWADLPVRNTNQWNELRDPTTGESLDLAFIIDGEEPQDELDWGDCFDAVGALAYNTLLA